MKEEYQRNRTKSRGSDLSRYSKRLLLPLLLSGGLIVFNIESIDIDVNFIFGQTEVTEIKTDNSTS